MNGPTMTRDTSFEMDLEDPFEMDMENEELKLETGLNESEMEMIESVIGVGELKTALQNANNNRFDKLLTKQILSLPARTKPFTKATIPRPYPATIPQPYPLQRTQVCVPKWMYNDVIVRDLSEYSEIIVRPK